VLPTIVSNISYVGMCRLKNELSRERASRLAAEQRAFDVDQERRRLLESTIVIQTRPPPPPVPVWTQRSPHK
jgi:hypothetical protein